MLLDNSGECLWLIASGCDPQSMTTIQAARCCQGVLTRVHGLVLMQIDPGTQSTLTSCRTTGSVLMT